METEMDKVVNVVASKGEPAKLYLSGTIRKEYPWEDEGDCISANIVRGKLEEIGEQDLEVYLNSGGGDVFESISICNLLKAHKGKLKIIVTGLAGSGASIICTAGKVAMYSNTMQMIHKAATIAWGNADDLRKEAETLDKIDDSVRASYKKKFVGTEEELKGLIAEETWLTAEECLAFGLCDEIIDEIEESPEGDPENRVPEVSVKENLFAKYKKIEVSEVADNRVGLFDAFGKNKKE